MSGSCSQCKRFFSCFVNNGQRLSTNFHQSGVNIFGTLNQFRWLSLSREHRRKLMVPRLTQDKVNLQKRLQIKYSDEYVQHKIEEYNLGTRRLARMMGKNPDTFTENDVSKAIRYLFPTDLFCHKSRPLMEHPSKVFPLTQKLKVDSDGRPLHHLFYTCNPELNQAMSDVYKQVLEAQKLNDDNKGRNTPAPLSLDDSQWMDEAQLSELLHCTQPISTRLHAAFISQLERLIEEPFGAVFKHTVMTYRKVLPRQTAVRDNAQITIDADGRKFSTGKGKRKTAFAEVRVMDGGSGIITVNGKDMRHFFILMQDRECLIAPFVFLRMIGRFDVDATVDGGFSGTWCMLNGSINHYVGRNKSAMAGAIRLGIARALLAFINDEEAEQLRRAGLLTYDVRTRERKKPGKEGARKRQKFKKR